MDDTVILTELEAQVRSMPRALNAQISGIGIAPTLIQADYEWLGNTVALLGRWHSHNTIFVRTAAGGLHGPLFDQNAATTKVALYEAIGDLKLRLQARQGGAFGPNAVYDYFRALKDTISIATSDVFVADPYLDDQIFDYVSAAVSGASIRLLMSPKQLLTASVVAARTKFQQQHGRQVEVRTSKAFHDRVIFINRQTCYLSGASIKDAAQRAPTYLAPLASDLIQDKLADYEAIWTNATPI
jgi:hypothetical protein